MKLLGLLIGAAAITACGGGDDFSARTCVPGVTQECACPGGAVGAQACSADGNGYEACQCGGGSGSGGSAGNGQSGSAGAGGATGGAAGSGTGGAGGSCTPRSMCPAPPEDGGTQLCGMLDDYCGGKLSCGCEFGTCNGGACQCARITAFDQKCAMGTAKPIAMLCPGAGAIANCDLAPAGSGLPAHGYCCAKP